MIKKVRDWVIYPALALFTIILVALNFIQYGTPAPREYDLPPFTGDIMEQGKSLLVQDTTQMAYGEFKRAERQIEQMRNAQEDINRGRFGESINSPLISVAKLRDCYTCYMAGADNEDWDQATTSHYLVLPGYILKEETGRFFMYRQQPWMAYWSGKTPEGPVDSVSPDGRYSYRKIPARLQPKEIASKARDEREKISVMIPISASAYKYLHTTLLIVIIVVGLLWLRVGVATPIKLLIRVSRGEIFTTQNERQLSRAATWWLAVPFLIISLHYVCRLIFYRYIPADVELTPFKTFQSMQWLFIGGMIILAVSKAFKKGLSLQEEQTLTI